MQVADLAGIIRSISSGGFHQAESVLRAVKSNHIVDKPFRLKLLFAAKKRPKSPVRGVNLQ